MWRRRALLVLAAGVPLVFLRQAHDPINVPKLSLLVVGVSLIGALRIAEGFQGRGFEGLRLLEIPAAAILVPLLLGLLFSPYRGWALFGHYPRFTGFLPYLFVILYAALVADAFRGDALGLARALVIAGGAAGFYAVIQRVGLDPFTWAISDGPTEVVSSTLGNPNFVGGFLAIVMPVALAVLLTDRDNRMWLGVASAGIVGGWLAAVSQGGWAAGIAGIAIVAGYALANRWSFARLGALVVTGLMAIGLVVAVLIAALGETSDVMPLSVERRGDWWRAASSMAADSPIVGRGPGSFALEHSRYRTVEDARLVGYDITDDPHSVPLAFLVSAGVIGLAGLLYTAGWFVRRGLVLDRANLIAVGFFGGVVAYLVQALVSVDTIALRTAFWTSGAGLVAATAAATEIVRSRRATKKSRRQPLQAPIAVAVVALVAVLGAWWGLRIVRADMAFANAFQALDEGDILAMQGSFDKARSLRDDVFYRRSEGNANGRLAVSAVLGGEREIGTTLLDRARDAFSYLPDFHHANSIADYARVLRDYGTINLDNKVVNLLTGKYDPEALSQSFSLYQEALELDPNNASLLGDTTDVGMALEEYDTVVQLLQARAEELDRVGVWGRLALAQARLGNEEEARAAAERAFELDPEEPNATAALEVLDPPE